MRSSPPPLDHRLDIDQLQLALTMSGVSVWRLDIATQRVYANDEGFRMLGLKPRPEGWDSDDLMQYVHPDDRDYVSQQILRAAGGSGPTQYEFRVMLPDGQARWLASRSVPVFDAQGHLVRRLGVNWDITASREAEAQRQAKAVAERE